MTAFETRFPIDGYKPLQDPPVSDLAKASELVACLERLLPAVISSLILELDSKAKFHKRVRSSENEKNEVALGGVRKK